MVAGACAMAGCDNKMKEQNAALTQENETLRAQLTDRETALESAQAELRDKTLQLTRAEREQRTGGGASSSGTQRDPFAGIEGITTEFGRGEIKATVESDVLFDSGKTSLKPGAKTSLDQVAGVLNSQLGGQMIRVAGFTDTDPIKKSKFPSNYHLGFERAFVVREYLISKGVDSKRISLSSYGPDIPKGSKPQSRRVEIVAIQP
jgi:flagellar motor protein MotB